MSTTLNIENLSGAEQTVLMTLAYLYDKSFTKKDVYAVGKMLHGSDYIKRAVEHLMVMGIIEEANSYYYHKNCLSVKYKYLFFGLYPLTKRKNTARLTTLRKYLRNTMHTSNVSTIVSRAFRCIDEALPESRRETYYYAYESQTLTAPLAEIIDNEYFNDMWANVPSFHLIPALETHCEKILAEDEDYNWDQLYGNMEKVLAKAQKDKDTANEVKTCMYLYYYLGTGRLKGKLEQMPLTRFSYLLGGIVSIYNDDYTSAYKCFAKAMAEYNKTVQRADEKNVFRSFVLNYYYMLAMTLYNKDVSLKRITSMNNKADYLRYTNSSLMVELFHTYFVKKEEINIDPADYNFRDCFSAKNQWASMFITRRLLKTLDEWPEGLNEENLKSHTPRAAWLLQELTKANLQGPMGATSALSKLSIKKVWQLRLEDILSYTDDPAKAQGEQKETWLQYFLDGYGGVDVIQKKRLKNGSWSTGKQLSVKAFKNLPTSEMDNADRELANHMKSWDYEIALSSAIFYLVGCDHVFCGDRYAPSKVTIHEDKPYLIINKNKNGTFSVASNLEETEGEPGSGQYYKANSDVDYSVIYVSAFEEKVYRQILQQGTYPAEAEPLLLKLMSTIGGRTEIHSNMVEEFNNMEQVKGCSTIIVRCQPSNYDSYNLVSFVQPIQGLIFPPTQGNITTIAEQNGKKVQVVRDMKKEKQNLHALTEQLCNLEEMDSDDDWSETPGGISIEVSLGSLLEIMQWVKDNEDTCTLEWPEGVKMKYHPAVSSGMAHIGIKSKNGWFEIEGEVKIDDNQVLSLQKLLELMHASNKSKYIKVGKDEYISLSRDLSRLLRRIDTVSTEQRSHLQMAPAAVGVLGDLFKGSEMEGLIDHSAIDSLLQRIRESRKKQPKVPATLQATLRDYQEEGFEWMSKLTSWGAGACLADDMGLGKTLQTIALILEQVEEGPSLVVAPASVVPNWRSELTRFAPTLHVTLLNQVDNRKEAIEKTESGDVVVTTYALLNLEQDDLVKKEWNVICLDEAHTIKNPNTKMSKAAMRMQAKRKVILTGTPIQNHLSELWNLFQFINPGLLGSAEQFSRKFIQPIEGDHDKERQGQLRRLIMPFMLRRTKGEVIEELPEKNEIQVPVELSGEEMTMYEVYRRKAENAVKADEKVQVSTLAEITRLRQMACSVSLVDKKWKKESSKVMTFIDLAESLNDSGNRALVFSQFTSFFSEIRKAMDKAKLPYLYLDGATPMAQREKLVREFQKGHCPFFLISLKAGGLGLNLTGANYVIHLDPWWNPAIEQQATDRAYRIGQKQDVTVYHLISEHTIEEKIVRLHKTKRDLADSLLEGADMAHALTQQELLELLQEK